MMRRVKSAPANLSEMCNRKNPMMTSNKNILTPFYSFIKTDKQLCVKNNQIKTSNNKLVKKIDKEIIKLNNFKNHKFTLKVITNYINDIVQTPELKSSLEEYILFSGFIEFWSENIYKKISLDKIINYILVYLVKYILNLYLVSHSINSDLDFVLQITHIKDF